MLKYISSITNFSIFTSIRRFTVDNILSRKEEAKVIIFLTLAETWQKHQLLRLPERDSIEQHKRALIAAFLVMIIQYLSGYYSIKKQKPILKTWQNVRQFRQWIKCPGIQPCIFQHRGNSNANKNNNDFSGSSRTMRKLTTPYEFMQRWRNIQDFFINLT